MGDVHWGMLVGMSTGCCDVSDESWESTPKTKSTLYIHCMLANLTINYILKKRERGAPGWLSRLGIRLQLRSRSRGP